MQIYIFQTLVVVLLSLFFSSQRNTDHISRSQESHGTIYSPFKDVPIPDITFTEYVFSKLDQNKNLTCLVSVLNKAHCSRQNQVQYRCESTDYLKILL